MGVIVCDSPTKSFSVTVMPKCGSTTMRTLLLPFARPGQYIIQPDGRIVKDEGWALGARFKGECGMRSWAVVRNPWARVLSRWREKKITKTHHKVPVGRFDEWPDYVDNLRLLKGTKSCPTLAIDQAWFLGITRPKHVVNLEAIDEWLPRMEAKYGISVGPPVRLRHHGDYDWKDVYRRHPETRDEIREMFAPDWNLGFDWEDPLA